MPLFGKMSINAFCGGETMCPKRSFRTGMTVLLVIAVLACLLSCGDVDREQTEERLRFIEFFLFPTAPYVDKSYLEVEKVPEDELATKQIDFEAEKRAIQEVYSAFIKAFDEEDIRDLTKTFDKAYRRVRVQFGTPRAHFEPIVGWNNVKTNILACWDIFGCRAIGNAELTDFYLRPKNVSAPWAEATAKGPTPVCSGEGCTIVIGYIYFTKRTGKWLIRQVNGQERISDDRYKMP